MTFASFIMLFLLGVGLVMIVLATVSGRRSRQRKARDPDRTLRACTDCQFLNRPQARFCAQCGAALPPPNGPTG
jgi:uncharacterized paraquat-inducible protein A